MNILKLQLSDYTVENDCIDIFEHKFNDQL